MSVLRRGVCAEERRTYQEKVMAKKIKLLSVVGARPQFIKAAAISRAIRLCDGPDVDINEVIVHTGQHYDDNMSRIFFEELEIGEPDYNLGIGSYPREEQIEKMRAGLKDIFQKENPDWIVVYGDTNSTLAGALAAEELKIPIAHIEAGLRSFNNDMPEEKNRILTDRKSDILFCPTETAVKNLADEKIVKSVHNVGDVMYDTTLYYTSIDKKHSEKLRSLFKEKIAENYYLATIHRAGNTDDVSRLKNILIALNNLDFPVIFPVHPRTLKVINELGLELLNVHQIEPLSYLDMLVLESKALMILTDSGGVQKEAYFNKKYCVTLRDETEWVETTDSGNNILAGAVANCLAVDVGTKPCPDCTHPLVYTHVSGILSATIVKSGTNGHAITVGGQ